MSRDPRLYLQEIKECSTRVIAYSSDMSQDQFETSGMAYDAILRNLEIIGEASKGLPQEVRDLAPEVPWRMICGFRDHLAHAYFGLDNDTVWEVVNQEIPTLAREVENLLRVLQSGGPPPEGGCEGE
jgi:uncharacterized protein with HEPN domain